MRVKNVGWRDAGLRAFGGALLLLLSASLRGSPLLALAAGFVAIIVLATALYRVCPLYTILRINTSDREVLPR